MQIVSDDLRFVDTFFNHFNILALGNDINSKIIGGGEFDISHVVSHHQQFDWLSVPVTSPVLYQVSIRLYRIHFCGGSIIKPDWVLTVSLIELCLLSPQWNIY